VFMKKSLFSRFTTFSSVFFAILLASFSGFATCDAGYAPGSTTFHTFGANNLLAIPLNVPQGGILTGVTLGHVNDASYPNFKAAIYTRVGNDFNLIVATNSPIPAVFGEATIDLPNTPIAAGDYYIVINLSSNGRPARVTSGPSLNYRYISFPASSNFPNNFTTSNVISLEAIQIKANIDCVNPADFVTRWDLPTGQTSITFNAGRSTGGVDYTWETIPASASGNGTLAAGLGPVTISGIPSGATIRLSLSPDNLQRFYIAHGSDRLLLSDVEAWGTAGWTGMQNAFQGCENLDVSASDIPDLNNVSSCALMFTGCSSLTGPTNINDWNMSTVTSIALMFEGASSFNQSLDSWNTANVTNMNQVFKDATIFNGNISSWNTSAVTSMSGMFWNAQAFNQNIGAWTTNNVNNMSFMFTGAAAFNQPLNSWVTSNVLNMSFMFYSASTFNQPLNLWNTVNVNNMSFMFRDAVDFNQPIGSWNTVNVANMSNMFRNASNFDQPIGSWNTVNVQSMSEMFWNATSFNQPIGSWNTINVTNMQRMFFNASVFNQTLNTWNTSNVTNMSSMFHSATNFNQPLANWNTVNVSNMSDMFHTATNFNQPINSWNTMNVQNMTRMFSGATSFNQDLNLWNTISVTNMHQMFINAINFDGNISTWNTSSVSNMSLMFEGAQAFNQALNSWNINSVQNMSRMFLGASSFNQTLSNWNPSTATDLSAMFFDASSFNQNIGMWVLNGSVNIQNMLSNSGLDCNNYAQTLIGWQNNNPTVTNRNLGASGRTYGTVAQASRNQLTTTQNWVISGDVLISSNPYVVPTGQVISANGIDFCNSEFTNMNNQSQKIAAIDANGNTIDLNTVEISISNSFQPALPANAITVESGNSGYYEINDGINTFRLSRRLITVNAAGNFNVNGGVLFRFYYDADDLNGIFADAMPFGTLGNFGWCKISNNDPQAIVNGINASAPNIAGAVAIIPTYGTENGANYAEFLVESFSTFAIYAQTQNVPLPVELTSLSANCNKVNTQLSWTTASEFNAAHFTVQMSRDGTIWNDLGEVQAVGTTSLASNYLFETTNSGALAYYRLIQEDLDGTQEIFGPISSNCSINNNIMSVYPNPASENFNILIQTVDSFKNSVVELIDLSGRVILSQTTDINAGSTMLNFDGKTLIAGTYIVRVKGENDSFAPLRFVKM